MPSDSLLDKGFLHVHGMDATHQLAAALLRDSRCSPRIESANLCLGLTSAASVLPAASSDAHTLAHVDGNGVVCA